MIKNVNKNQELNVPAKKARGPGVPKQQGASERGKLSKASDSIPTGVCYNCQEPGHIKKDCPNPIQTRKDKFKASGNTSGKASGGILRQAIELYTEQAASFVETAQSYKEEIAELREQLELAKTGCGIGAPPLPETTIVDPSSLCSSEGQQKEEKTSPADSVDAVPCAVEPPAVQDKISFVKDSSEFTFIEKSTRPLWQQILFLGFLVYVTVFYMGNVAKILFGLFFPFVAVWTRVFPMIVKYKFVRSIIHETGSRLDVHSLMEVRHKPNYAEWERSSEILYESWYTRFEEILCERSWSYVAKVFFGGKVEELDAFVNSMTSDLKEIWNFVLCSSSSANSMSACFKIVFIDIYGRLVKFQPIRSAIEKRKAYMVIKFIFIPIFLLAIYSYLEFEPRAFFSPIKWCSVSQTGEIGQYEYIHRCWTKNFLEIRREVFPVLMKIIFDCFCAAYLMLFGPTLTIMRMFRKCKRFVVSESLFDQLSAFRYLDPLSSFEVARERINNAAKNNCTVDIDGSLLRKGHPVYIDTAELALAAFCHLQRREPFPSPVV